MGNSFPSPPRPGGWSLWGTASPAARAFTAPGRRRTSPPPGSAPSGPFPSARRTGWGRSAALSARAAGGSAPTGGTIPATPCRISTRGSAALPPGGSVPPWGPGSPGILPPGSRTPSSSTWAPTTPGPWRIRPGGGQAARPSGSARTRRGLLCWKPPPWIF